MDCRLLLMTISSLMSPGISFIRRKAFFTFVEALEEMREGSMRPIMPQLRLAASRADPHAFLLP
ncbi:MAG: hypothetical protein CVV35_06765 [Methanomicrobiales archaeon HGW-Methanomicrobiales-6]|nr:MAG: hypothetical protein CVV35_06765 [Methanomicrobiales archaeon HGW-Methanomicrobiales-6]